MSGAKNCPETPRQKMIGMMYLVLTAMLALNVSTDVLKAFKLVDDSLHTTLATTDGRNKALMDDFRAMRDENPQKVAEWYNKANELTQRSDSVFNYIQSIKYGIAVKADKKKADPEARVIEGNDNREAAAQWALPNVGEQPGVILRKMIEEYRDYLISLDSTRVGQYGTMFDTSSKPQKDGEMMSWEYQMFHDMPAGAAVALMTKLQNDVRNAQLEMIQHLRKQTDAGDVRVNKLSAYVIPESNLVVRGSKYKAQIIMAAVDSTQTPEYYIDGTRLSNDQGIYEVVASSIGQKKYSGWISYLDPSGEMKNLHFSSTYTVMEPAMTISNNDLKVMYRDYPNKFSISVSGVVDDSKITVEVPNVHKEKSGKEWIIKPGEKNTEVSIIVWAEIDGRKQKIGEDKYKVLDLPKPRAFFKFEKNEYDGSKPVARSVMTNPKAYIGAGYGSDVVLQLDYDVISFKARIRGMVTESEGNHFSSGQIKRIKDLDGGTVINLVDIKVRPKGGTSIMTLSPFPLELK